MIVTVNKSWGLGLDLAKLARNWTQDGAGAQRRMGNRAGAVEQLAAIINHLAARYPATPFAECRLEGTVQATGTSLSPLYSYRNYDLAVNARTRVVRIIALPRRAGTGDCTLSKSSGGETAHHNSTVAAPDFPEDLFYAEFEADTGGPSGGLATDTILVDNGFTVVDVVVQDKELEQLDSATHTMITEGVAKAGGKLMAGILEDCRDAFHDIRRKNLGVEITWAAQQDAAGWVAPSAMTAGGDGFGIPVTDTSWVNLLDQTVASRTASSPGFSCPARYAGLGTQTEAEGKSVRLWCGVFAAVTGSPPGAAGTVRFEGPDHVATNYVDISPAVAGTPAWFDAATPIYLNTEAADTDATTARNKVDIFGEVANAGDYLGVYGFRAQKVFQWPVV